jgi:putative phosphoesterase
MRIGILSDTHGFLRKEVIEGLQGVDHIIHAGDVDKKEVLDELEKIAPVTAVRGNADKDWAVYLPEKALLEFGGNKIYVIHNKGKIDDFIEDIPIIIYGHSHKYSMVEKNGQVWFNPGCCGKRKPDQEVSFAILEIRGKGDFSFEKKIVRTESSTSSFPKNIDSIISKAMKLSDKGTSHKEIAAKLKISEDLAEQICRMYFTHPGVDVAGILQRISN